MLQKGRKQGRQCASRGGLILQFSPPEELKHMALLRQITISCNNYQLGFPFNLPVEEISLSFTKSKPRTWELTWKVYVSGTGSLHIPKEEREKRDLVMRLVDQLLLDALDTLSGAEEYYGPLGKCSEELHIHKSEIQWKVVAKGTGYLLELTGIRSVS